MEDGLRDIKPLLEIPDSSYYLFLMLVFLLIAVFLVVLGLLVKKFWKKKKIDMKIVYLHHLKKVNWIDTKHSAYEVTHLGRLLTLENERAKEIYEQLVPMLERYKYQKEVPRVDEMTLRQYNLLVHVIDESL